MQFVYVQFNAAYCMHVVCIWCTTTTPHETNYKRAWNCVLLAGAEFAAKFKVNQSPDCAYSQLYTHVDIVVPPSSSVQNMHSCV